MNEQQEPKLTFAGLPPQDFYRLWNTGTLAYSCQGCGLPLPDGEEGEWCERCEKQEQARLEAWNRAAMGGTA